MSLAHTTTPNVSVSRDKIQSSQGTSSAKASAVAVRPFSLRGFTSILLMLCLLMMLGSGISLYIAPRGRVANMTAWAVIGLSRQQWLALHINASLLFVAVSISHLAMNWSRLVGYLRKRSSPGINMKRELAAAVALAAAIFASTVVDLPPINLPVEFRYEVRDSWEQVEPSVARNNQNAGHAPQVAR